MFPGSDVLAIYRRVSVLYGGRHLLEANWITFLSCGVHANHQGDLVV
jgi:hypothetical protein